MKNETTVIKALKVIESISSTIGTTTKKKIAVDRRDIDNIYAYAHIASGTCDNPHKDWVNQLNEHYDRLKKMGEI